MPPSLNTLTCVSWLVYATRATDDAAKRVKTLILNIKTDRIDPRTAVPVVQLIIEQAANRLGVAARAAFEGHPMLVPVPGSGLTKPNTVWPAKRVCEELLRQGFGEDVLPALKRTTSVPKSAGSLDRPPLAEHVRSLTVQKGLTPPSRLLLVDDVVTSGTTMIHSHMPPMALALAISVRRSCSARSANLSSE